MAQMQTISIRIPDDDYQWLLTVADGEGRTPSEQLRTQLAQARQQQAGLDDYELCHAWMRSLIQPFVDSVAGFERKQRMHSDVVGAVSESLPRIMATAVSARLGGKSAMNDAIEIEATLAQQCFRMLTALLRTAITSVPSNYDKSVLDRHVQEIIEMAAILSTQHDRRLKNG